MNELEDICGIYKITNNINGHSYIGQSIHIRLRFYQHKLLVKNGKSSLYDAFRKYGLENFTFEVLEECKKEDLNIFEQYWIDYYDTYNNGYNETPGGDTSSIKMSKPVVQYSLEGKFIKEYPSAMEAYRQTGVGASNLGSVCLKQTTTAGGYQWFFKGEENPQDLSNYFPQKVVSVKQYDLNGKFIKEYPTAKIASLETGSDYSRIIKNCKNQIDHSGDYQWRYSEDTLNNDDISPIIRQVKKHKKAVNQYDLDNNLIATYNSIMDAERNTGINNSAISSVCRGLKGYKSAGGYKWEYA